MTSSMIGRICFGCLGLVALRLVVGWWGARGMVASVNNTKTNSTATNDAYHKQSTNPSPSFQSKAQFVFTMGLEGTGHHLMAKIVPESPHFRKAKRLGTDFSEIKRLLFSKRGPQKKMGLLTSCHDDSLDVQRRLRKFSHMLSEINEAVTLNATTTTSDDGPTSVVRVPLNAYKHGTMISYPFGGTKECRKLNYPNIDTIYQACEMAKVDCHLVYLYRDPYEILRSTVTNRRFNKDVFTAIHLYTSLLKVISTELRLRGHRTLGCFGFYEEDNTSWWDGVRDIWGWTNHSEYETFMNATYSPPSKHTNDGLVPETLEPYMKSFLSMHELAVESCRASLLESVS